MTLHDEHDDRYYRLLDHPENGVVVVCMQWFDEIDYDADDFISDEKYPTEGEAEKALTVYLLRNMRSETITLKAEAFDLLVQELERPARVLPKLQALIARQRP